MFKKYFIFLFSFISIFSCLFQSKDTSNSTFLNDQLDYFKPIHTNLISSTFGWRELHGKANLHDGIDYPAPPQTPIYATKSGIVTNANFLNGYGNTVILLHHDGTKSLYGHLSETFLVFSGQTVVKGQIIGKVGPKYLSDGRLNGFTTGPHLHFTVYNEKGKQIDPLSLNLQEPIN